MRGLPLLTFIEKSKKEYNSTKGTKKKRTEKQKRNTIKVLNLAIIS
jgi:hypothetical protein